MQTSPELILDAISLSISSPKEGHKKIVKDFIALNDEKYTGTIGVAESIDSVAQLYLDILKNSVASEINQEDPQSVVSTLLKYEASPVVQKDPIILDTMRKLFSLNAKLPEKKIDTLAKKVSTSIDLNIISKYMRKMYKKIRDGEQTTDPNTKSVAVDGLIADAREMVEVLVDNKNQVEGSATEKYLERINMNDKEDIARAVKQHSTRTKHVFKTGLQGLNKMFGKIGGIKLGESISINALKHNYKSGMLMSFAKWIIMYNKPYIDPERPGIPTILFITLENEANENIMWWFESMYVSMYNKAPEGLKDDEIVELVYQFFQDSGYTLIIERKLGADFGYEEYVQMYERYVRDGHRILVSIIDYMNMMKKGSSGSKDGRSDLSLRELYNKMCNFNKNRMTTQISAHQLNREAARLVVGGTNIVKKFNDSHYADGMDVGREVDMEIFVHIERNNSGTPFLTMMRGKHRYVNDTPDKDKYVAYEFKKTGIKDDINEEQSEAVKNIYAEDASEEDIIASVKGNLGTVDTKQKIVDAIF